jgi:hypothetical protein
LRLLEQLDALQQQQPSEPPAVSKEKLDELERWLQTVEETRTAAQRARESLAHLEEQGELAEQNVRQFGFPAGDDANWARLNGEKRGLWWLPALCGGPMAAAGFAAPAPWHTQLFSRSDGEYHCARANSTKTARLQADFACGELFLY